MHPQRPRRVWLDVGAHLGEHSRAAARADPDLTVHAFEPLPHLFAALADGPANYHVHAAAVGEQDGMAAFHVNRFDAASSLLPMVDATRALRRDGHLLEEVQVIQVNVTRLDTFLRRHAIDRVEFLKIEAQGADLAVLRSAGDRLPDIDRVQLEVAVTPTQLYQGAASKSEVLAFMAAHGFWLVQTEPQSHGQEENLTFARQASRPFHSEPPRDGAETGAVALYDLAAAQLAYGEISRTGDELQLVTDPRQWAYTAIVPIGDTSAKAQADWHEVGLEIRVDSGAVQVGILNREETDFAAAVTLQAGPDWRSVRLLTPPLARAGPLVIRNAAGTGPSRAVCRRRSVTRLVAAASPREEVAPLASSEETGFLVSQLAGAAARLEQIVAAQPKIATEQAMTLAEAVVRLRRALIRGGCALLAVRPAEFADLFASFSTEQLLQIAEGIAAKPQPRSMPGWRMDAFLESGDFAPFVRYAVCLALRARADAAPIVVPWLTSTRLRIDIRNDLGFSIFVGGAFEPNEFALLDRVLRPGMTVLDGGANEGAYTVFLAARVGRQGRIIAVEPSPRECGRLNDNLALNRLDNVTIVAAALTEQDGELALRLAEAEHAGLNTLGEFFYEGVAHAGIVAVGATTIDRLVQAQCLTELDVVKLDIEGAELRALAGGRESLRRWRPLLLLEAAPAALARQGGSLQDLLKLLAESSYRVLSLDPTSAALVPIGDQPLSDNLVAVHPERDWGLLTS